jgi:hypothetical protein
VNVVARDIKPLPAVAETVGGERRTGRSVALATG